MNVLVVGSGGREHALCWAIAKSPLCGKLYCLPGNAGIAQVAECTPIAVDRLSEIVAFALAQSIDLVVVGPEAPLVAGLADMCDAAGLTVFGPSAKAAMIEGSKGFMKDLCARYGIPSAAYGRFDEPEAAKEFIHRHGAPVVVKADGLASGKGVIICHNENEAHAAVDHIMVEGAFGKAGGEVIIEEYLKGEEASFFVLTDGTTILPLASAQDHKAAFDGDQGPNTGGMGAYSPAPVVDDELAEAIMDRIVRPTVDGLKAEGRPYRGILYAGVMVTDQGPKVLEFNARFGDPECQPLLVRLKSDLLEALYACARGRLNEVTLQWADDAALVVVLATRGYPGYFVAGSEIHGLDAAAGLDDVVIFHAATALDNGHVLATGGRVLGVTACAPTVKEAKALAYRAVDLIDWPEGFCRRDIGWRAIARS
ncbi:MAG: phosphoribosylamine--glycine ligase [Rhodospirillales bacterium]|jgi:phosphoribosylamine--glycine ligase|nr:phosphoribosylamine--glycine ligase [Rhodospirillales bacterium]